MKKRFVSLLLAAVLTTALAVPAGAAGTVSFSDIPDRRVSLAVESMRLMGVLDGYSDNTFRPNQQLTRAQFCKMAVYALGAENTLGLYSTTTVFPDVKPSYWAAGYINLAAKGKNIIAGYPDGKFYPERTVTAGQAVTILLRLLGYEDKNIGGVWPDSYMATAAMAGLTENLTLSSAAPLTRGQAAQLFLNLLQTETGGEKGVSYTLSSETELLSVDGSTGEMRTTDKTYTMAHPTDNTSLIGARGYVVELNNKAMTFLPLTNGNAGTASAAIVVYADGSADGFGALAGNNSYTIYKNGTRATVKDLRKDDVASYYPGTNTIRVCDTRVTVYYEACDPNPSNPASITVLGGTRFSVLPSAVDTLAKFKPGDRMTLLLTADGQVAGAVSADDSQTKGNAVGVVSGSGKVDLLCAGRAIPLSGTAGETYREQVVRITATGMNKLSLSIASGGVRGDLNVATRQLGGRKLAENAMIYQSGELTSLSSFTSGVIRSGEIALARANWAGEIDLVVIRGGLTSTVVYGRVFGETESSDVYLPDKNGVKPDEDGYIVTKGDPIIKDSWGVEYGNGLRTATTKVQYEGIVSGEYVRATLRNQDGKMIINGMKRLTKLADVSNSAWAGTGSVLAGGRSYAVPANVLCYNADSKTWVDLETAQKYSDIADLYADDGVIRIVEVRHRG